MPNRIVFGAHPTNFGIGNRFSGRHKAYYRARAEGGAGLIVTEALTVHSLDWPYEHIPFGHTDAVLASLSRVVDTIRLAGNGTLVTAQLNHSGSQSDGKLLRQSPWAPSAVPDVASRRQAREMNAEQIGQIVAGFGECAARVVQAGLDGVELNAGQNSLLRQFLSPLSNFRADEYGGALENRLRFPLDVISSVRAALGPGRILGLKLCGDELAPWGGLTPEDAVEIARHLLRHPLTSGKLDYLSIQIGGPYSTHMTDAGMPIPQGHAAHLAQAVREGIAGSPETVPVFAEGRIESPDTGAAVLANGQADAVVMTRALISDPALPRKAAGLEEGPVRPHIGMTRYFSVVGDWNRPVGDLINPRAGREERLPAVRPLENPRPAMVIGGGPAGLEAATLLARQGRDVTLREAGDELGGMAALLSREAPNRQEFALLVKFYLALMSTLKVKVILNAPVDRYESEFDGYETLFCAIGAGSPAPPFSVTDGAAVSPRHLLAEGKSKAPAEGRAAVVDLEFGFRMAAAVEWLLEAGWKVDVITPDFFVGRGLVESAEMLWFQRVAAAGAVFHPLLTPTSFGQGTLHCKERFSKGEKRFAGIGLLVVAQAEIPDSNLFHLLRASHPRVWTIGDARAPRLMGEAILHAHRTVLLE